MQDLKAIHVLEGHKVSHNYMGKDVVTYGYRHLIDIGVPSIGIPGKQNNLIIMDIDVESEDHAHDGRQWWEEFVQKAGIPRTYMVSTPSGGYHCYFRLPVAINPELFQPPSELAPGVDIKWNGWVAAPPTVGYQPLWGCPDDIIDAPVSLIAEIQRKKEVGTPKGMNPSDPYAALSNMSTPFSEQQINELRKRIEWLQASGTLSREEWRNGLFSLKAGVRDPELLDELLVKWTMNKAYVPGDENVARDMVQRAEIHRGIGPGTIFKILKNVALREGAPIVASPYTFQEIIDKSKVKINIDTKGNAKIAPTESNVASIIGAMFDSEHLYHDIRMDNYVYKNKVYSDQELANIFTPILQSTSYGLGFENIRKSLILGGIEVLMADRQVDPHKRWLESLQWDGVPRIDTFFTDYCRVVDNPYVRAVSKNFWIAMAARGIDPGTKFDNMLVLEGPEGARKSSLCEVLAGEYYMSLSSKEDINSPEVLRRMHQHSIVELPELVGLSNRTGEEVKAILATRKDSLRALYARKGVSKERGFLFIGTTNPPYDYIKEDMGYRRYWPIRIPAGTLPIDIDKIKFDRDKLFAEAVARYQSHEHFWEIPEGLRSEVHERMEQAPLLEPVRDVMRNSRNDGLKVSEIYKQLEMSGYVSKGLSQGVVKRIQMALRGIGATEKLRGNIKVWTMPVDFDRPGMSFI